MLHFYCYCCKSLVINGPSFSAQAAEASSLRRSCWTAAKTWRRSPTSSASRRPSTPWSTAMSSETWRWRTRRCCDAATSSDFDSCVAWFCVETASSRSRSPTFCPTLIRSISRRIRWRDSSPVTSLASRLIWRHWSCPTAPTWSGSIWPIPTFPPTNRQNF